MSDPLFGHHHDSLLDLSNERLEQLVTLDNWELGGDGQVSRVADPRAQLGQGGSCVPRADFCDTSMRVRNGGGNVYFRSEVPGSTPQCLLPCQNLHTNSMTTSQLSKTDRMVVNELINKLECVDGSDEFKLVRFLKNVLPILGVSPDNGGEVIKLLIPKVKGQLFKLWVEGIANKVDWDTLHSEVLHVFIPPLRRREIEAVELDRPQRPHENFAEYCENIIAAAFALKSRLTEEEVIEVAMNKCYPTNRNHFAFGEFPKNIRELRSLAMKVTGAMRAENRYFGNGRSDSEPRMNTRQGGENSRHTRDYRQGGGNSGNNTRDYRQGGRPQTQRAICFRCRKEGHIARNCSTHLNSK